MPTPQITMRVDKDRLKRWKDAVERDGTTVSEQIRLLMDRWERESREKNTDK